MKSTTLLLAACLCAATTTSHATVWRVNNNPNYTQGCDHCFNSLQAANDTSIVLPGDTIHLEASAIVYLGSGDYGFTVLSKRLVILGPGYFLNQNIDLQNNAVSATISKLIFLAGSEQSIINGIRFYYGSDIYSIDIYVSNILIENCYLGKGLGLRNSDPISNITIDKCYIVGGIGSTNANNISNLLIANSYFGGNINLYQWSFSRSGSIINCVLYGHIDINIAINCYNNIINTLLFSEIDNGITNVHDNIFIPNPPVWLIGGNNHSEILSDVFPTSGSQDAILIPLSTCTSCDSGVGGTQMGMYGGADPYKLSGIPNIPSIYQLQSPLDVIQGEPVNVTISTRGNN